MSNVEKRNIAIFALVVCVLLAGVGVLAGYTGILQAKSNEEPVKISCSSGEGECAMSSVEAAGFPKVHASTAEAGEASGCCPGEKPAVSCEDKPAGCDHDPSSGCCDKPKVEGCCEKPKTDDCCPTETDSTI